MDKIKVAIAKLINIWQFCLPLRVSGELFPPVIALINLSICNERATMNLLINSLKLPTNALLRLVRQDNMPVLVHYIFGIFYSLHQIVVLVCIPLPQDFLEEKVLFSDQGSVLAYKVLLSLTV